MSDSITLNKGNIMTNTKQTIDFVGVSNQWEDQDKNERKLNQWGQGINYGFYITTKENDTLTYLNTTFLDDLVTLFRTKYKIEGSYMVSSSMHFATESGYYHNDAAQRVWDLAYDIANSNAKDIKEYTNGVLNNSVRLQDIKFTDLV
tara:strand:- start:4926 stop:5366 length:441 start_codon:yes stop_codon:yes gene_type:complete